MTEQDEQPTPLPSDKSSEPAISTGGIVAGATLLLNGLILYGVQVTSEQKLYLLTVIAFLAPALAGFWIRFRVWSPQSVEKVVQHYQERAEADRERLVKASAEVQATKAAIVAVQETIPAAIQSALSQPLPPRESDLQDDYPRPPSDRVYGGLNGDAGSERREEPAPARYQPPDPQGYRPSRHERRG